MTNPIRVLHSLLRVKLLVYPRKGLHAEVTVFGDNQRRQAPTLGFPGSVGDEKVQCYEYITWLWGVLRESFADVGALMLVLEV